MDMDIDIELSTVDSKELEHGRRMLYADCPFSLVWGSRMAIF